MTVTQVFTNQSADGSSLEFTMNGIGLVHIGGTFGGGTATIEVKVVDSTNSINSDFVAAGGTNAYTTPIGVFMTGIKNVSYRITLSGSTAPTLNAYVIDNS